MSTVVVLVVLGSAVVGGSIALEVKGRRMAEGLKKSAGPVVGQAVGAWLVNLGLSVLLLRAFQF